jgi:hypothetical protein
LRVYLAHGKAADLKKVQNDQALAVTALVAAGGAATHSYAAMGGDARDLESFARAEQRANVALGAAMGDTDTDDQ